MSDMADDDARQDAPAPTAAEKRAFYPLTITDISREAPDAVAVSFNLADAPAPALFAFKPGQHLAIRAEIDGEEVRRTYSICAAPSDGRLRIAARALPGGRFSTFLNETVSIGDTIEVMPPTGVFTADFDAAKQKTYLMICAGSGVTPILSLISAGLESEPNSRFIMLYGNRDTRSAMFADELGALKDKYIGRLSLHFFFSREVSDQEFFNGHINADKIEAFLARFLPAETIDEAYLCGPAGMLEAAEAGLKKAGVADDAIHVERFQAGRVAAVVQAKAREGREAAAGAGACTVAVVMDGHERRFAYTPGGDDGLIEAAAQEGLLLPYACHGGMCATCRAKVLQGEVRMRQNYGLTTEEVEAGYVLMCQAEPVTDTLHVSYDE